MDQLSQFRSPAGAAAYFELGRNALDEGKTTGGLMDYDSRFKRHGPAAEQTFLTWLATAPEDNKAGDLKAAMIGMQLKEIGGEAALVELAKLTSSAHPNVAKTAQEISDEIQRKIDQEKKNEAQARADDETTPTPISPDVKLAVMARTLDDEFRHDPEGTRKKYNGQLIEVVGDLSSIRYTFQGKTSYTLMTNAGPMSMSFLCYGTQALHSKQFVPGQRVVIKGRADLEGMLSLKEAQIIDAKGPEPIEVTSEALVQEFADPEKIAAASKKYAGRWLLVTGKIKELQGNNNHASLVTGVDREVQLSLIEIPEAQQKALQVGQTIVFLGRFDKYDPYQVEVELDNCVLVARPAGP
ncbi:tRNA_anti-like protein [Anatilimnocola aggregata]|uniref:tRNA_anti-like protein n=1 Tax=Anatilimnocola aggregata TaxID=2528021 RepID=A0A517YMJ9_9BACT|nr:hypothetical protein [Anatilimnocola aggregata]QDU31449.1 tRNA_anti-like protein [Anatilimnocola aggregata]